MRCGTTEVHSLTQGESLLASKRRDVNEPHWKLAVEALPVLLLERMGAPRPKVGHVEDPSLRVEVKGVV
jgi:hypothetical protein